MSPTHSGEGSTTLTTQPRTSQFSLLNTTYHFHEPLYRIQFHVIFNEYRKQKSFATFTLLGHTTGIRQALLVLEPRRLPTGIVCSSVPLSAIICRFVQLETKSIPSGDTFTYVALIPCKKKKKLENVKKVNNRSQI